MRICKVPRPLAPSHRAMMTPFTMPTATIAIWPPKI